MSKSGDLSGLTNYEPSRSRELASLAVESYQTGFHLHPHSVSNQTFINLGRKLNFFN